MGRQGNADQGRGGEGALDTAEVDGHHATKLGAGCTLYREAEEPMRNERSKIDEEEWSKPDNWRAGLYMSTRDSRLMVPRRDGSGSSLNCGNTKVVTAAMIVLSIVTYVAIHR